MGGDNWCLVSITLLQRHTKEKRFCLPVQKTLVPSTAKRKKAFRSPTKNDPKKRECPRIRQKKREKDTLSSTGWRGYIANSRGRGGGSSREKKQKAQELKKKKTEKEGEIERALAQNVCDYGEGVGD